eukprot:14672881-Heterocapsa_arctica.AAC.1
MALWCWLKPDHNLNAVRQRLPLRRHLWQRLDELRIANKFSKYNFENAWINLATQDEGRVWLKLIKTWTNLRKKDGDAFLWANKHAIGGLADRRKQAAAERATAVHGVA